MTEIIPTEAENGEEYIGTIAEDTIIAGVTSLDGETGDLTLKTVNGNSLLGEGDIEIEGGGVNSVNGQTGDVTITASGIGAATESSLENLATTVSSKQDALSSAQLAAVNSGIDSTKVGQIATNTTDITAIEGKIPSAATSSNQLADKNFVNSSVATNTANYISNNGEPFDSLAELEAYSGTLTNNDYAFVVGTDAAGNTTYTRYKYNATTGEWAEEYVLNNSSFTSDQWAAINSGITSDGVTKLGGIESGAEVNVQANWNETDSASDAYIQNKPTIPDAPVQSNWNESDTTSLAYIQNKPTIPQGIVELTSANYNYPTNSPDGIAIWLLNAGHYSIKASSSQVKVYLDTSSAAYISANSESELIISGPDLINQKNYYYAGAGYSAGAKLTSTGYTQMSAPTKNFELLNVSTIVNNLTSTDTKKPLSANQGKVLKGLVDGKADNTAFTGTDGTADGAAGLVPAPLIADADKFLKSDGTWATAGGGGGIKTLTSADANYPVDNPTMIAAWLLDPGYYKIDNIRVYANASSYSNNGLVIVGKKPSNNIVPVVMLGEGRALYSCCVNATSGSIDEMTANASPLLINSIDDWLTSTNTKHALSANQGKVLNDKIGGNLSSLTTTDKTSLIAAINELASRVSALE